MIKLVASDLDGTLLQNGAQILSDELFPLIRRLREAGILFIAASGRQYANMKRLFAPVLDDMAFISENGGLVLEKEEILYQDAFDPALVMDIVQTIYDYDNAEFSCSTKDFYYVRPKTQEYLSLMQDYYKCECKVIDSFDEITLPCMKLAVYEPDGISEKMVHHWAEKFSDRCTVVTSGAAWVDFIPFGTNKAKGLRKFQEIYHISPEECMVFGDEYNDLAMLEAVPYSFAMVHAKPGVKKTAHYQAARVEPVLERLLHAEGRIEDVLREITG